MPYSHKFITNTYDKNGTRLLGHVYKHSGTITNSAEWTDRRRNLDQQDLTLDITCEVPRTMATPSLRICPIASIF
jgi:hypothetical protein